MVAAVYLYFCALDCLRLRLDALKQMVRPSAEARGVQYFEANVEEARQVVEGCRAGSVRGTECANAEEAIIKVEAEERRRRFLGQ